MAEHAVYGGNMYGTPNAELDRAFGEGKTPLLVLDLNGVRSLDLHPKYSACNVYVYTGLSELDARLKARYFGENLKADSEKNYNTRRAQNLADWRTLSEFEEHIHALIENSDTVEDCCERVLNTFYAYVDGEEKDEWANHAIVNGLAEEANEAD